MVAFTKLNSQDKCEPKVQMLNNYFKTVTANEELSMQAEALILSYMINCSCSLSQSVGVDLYDYLRDLIKEHAPDPLAFDVINDQQ